jgi:hypothetical protein
MPLPADAIREILRHQANVENYEIAERAEIQRLSEPFLETLQSFQQSYGNPSVPDPDHADVMRIKESIDKQLVEWWKKNPVPANRDTPVKLLHEVEMILDVRTLCEDSPRKKDPDRSRKARERDYRSVRDRLNTLFVMNGLIPGLLVEWLPENADPMTGLREIKEWLSYVVAECLREAKHEPEGLETQQAHDSELAAPAHCMFSNTVQAAPARQDAQEYADPIRLLRQAETVQWETTPAAERAFRSYREAETALESSGVRATDDRAYDWVKEHSRIYEDDIPDRETWKRYVRIARKKKNAQKKRSRRGRGEFRSAVRPDQIERDRD